MQFQVDKTAIWGCLKIYPTLAHDPRGVFIKTYHLDSFKQIGISESFPEEYFSVSKKDVLRGMHFQKPPAEHSKIVYCTSGVAFDVVLDLRRSSPTYGTHATFELAYDNLFMLYIPTGCAHGFLALVDNTMLFYRVSTQYNPICDTGILWNSFNCAWPAGEKLLSSRDAQLPPFSACEGLFP
jgi:dTDP-4-dehydrorhamnose 3,5-epimerase